MNLTRNEGMLLEYLYDRDLVSDEVPTYKDMCAHLGIKSKSGISYTMVSLEAKGFIQRGSGLPRSITILKPPKSRVSASPKVSDKERLLEVMREVVDVRPMTDEEFKALNIRVRNVISEMEG